jgi:hypothetical protein
MTRDLIPDFWTVVGVALLVYYCPLWFSWEKKRPESKLGGPPVGRVRQWPWGKTKKHGDPQ